MKNNPKDNRAYLIEELKIFKTCYESLKDGNEYDKLMAQKIKEEIEYIEQELNPFNKK